MAGRPSRAAISNLPDDHLLDAAQIIADAHELLGQPVVANRIALSKIHHGAFDNHLIGIDPDGRVHVSERRRSWLRLRVEVIAERLGTHA